LRRPTLLITTNTLEAFDMAKRKIEKTRARARRAERVTVFFFEPELALAILRPLDARTQVHGGPGAPPIRAALGAAAHWLRRTFMTGEEAHCLGCGRDITTAMPGRGVPYEIVVVEPVAPSARPVESGGLCRDCFAEPQPAKEAKVLKRLKLNPSPRSRPAAG
jgi:hypothetical protein